MRCGGRRQAGGRPGRADLGPQRGVRRPAGKYDERDSSSVDQPEALPFPLATLLCAAGRFSDAADVQPGERGTRQEAVW